MDTLTDEIESILFMAREVMVYQVPPRTSATGYKAADWNVETFLWKGRLRVVEIGDKCELKLEDTSTGELFASVTYVSPWTQVEPVLDSSRYFVLRVEGEGGKRAYIGMGFLERGEAFDFQVALQSVAKRASVPEPSSEPSRPSAPPKDYSLKDGQTFTIKIPGREGKRSSPGTGGSSLSGERAAGGGSTGSGGGLFALAPPPPPGRKR